MSNSPAVLLPFSSLPTVDSSLHRRPDPVYVMDLLPGLVGWIIGRSGTRIKEIQQQYSCKMWVDQDVPDNQPRKLYFQGTSQSIKLAVNCVNELLLDAPLLGGKHGVVDNILSKIAECPADLVGLLIGRKGWTIKKIQSQSGAQIAINQSVRDGLPRKIIVSGDERSVHHAISLIQEVLSTKPEPPAAFIDRRLQNASSLMLNERFPVINYHANETLLGKATSSSHSYDTDHELQALLESLSIGSNTPYNSTTNMKNNTSWNNFPSKSVGSNLMNNSSTTYAQNQNAFLENPNDYKTANPSLAYPYHHHQGSIGLPKNIIDAPTKPEEFLSSEMNSDSYDAFSFLISKGIW